MRFSCLPLIQLFIAQIQDLPLFLKSSMHVMIYPKASTAGQSVSSLAETVLLFLDVLSMTSHHNNDTNAVTWFLCIGPGSLSTELRQNRVDQPQACWMNEGQIHSLAFHSQSHNHLMNESESKIANSYVKNCRVYSTEKVILLTKSGSF